MEKVEKIVAQGLLYDFYGELLTKHQREVYEDLVYNDMSLSEIAEEYGISKQGVHDLIKRCTKILEGYEDKLHMVARFEEIRSRTNEIKQILIQQEESDFEEKDKIISLTDSIMEQLIR
ncbi:YlxM family DNA-binding protein [Butyrivibrio sp. NC3005]|uniref:YlxM family DNA-binding protein n=1 Tax=Butyrivibrio sp. NC3005 TaxID=1280685 RepID=UPI0003F6F212|nr:sigma factor-like helix-turn-helix DNA-binding protein [Butyrivibrio sp. NC3005]